MHASKWYGIGAGLVVLGMFAMAQESAPQQDKVIKHVPVKATNAASGQEMYTNYCAVCHGTDGKGGGPAASALKEAPADLTALTGKTWANTPPFTFPVSCAATRNWPPMGTKTCRFGVQFSVI